MNKKLILKVKQSWEELMNNTTFKDSESKQKEMEKQYAVLGKKLLDSLSLYEQVRENCLNGIEYHKQHKRPLQQASMTPQQLFQQPPLQQQEPNELDLLNRLSQLSMQQQMSPQQKPLPQLPPQLPPKK